MSKRHVNRQRNENDDNVLMSSIDDDVDFVTVMEAMDSQYASRKQRRAKKFKRNRFDDYERDEWLNSHSVDWSDVDPFEEDLDFSD